MTVVSVLVPGAWANGNPSVQRRSLVDLKRSGKDKLIS